MIRNTGVGWGVGGMSGRRPLHCSGDEGLTHKKEVGPQAWKRCLRPELTDRRSFCWCGGWGWRHRAGAGERYGGPENLWRRAFQSPSQHRPVSWPAVEWPGPSPVLTTIEPKSPGQPNFSGAQHVLRKWQDNLWWSPETLWALKFSRFHVTTKRRMNRTSFPVTNILYTKEIPLKHRIQMCRILYEKTVYIPFLFEKAHIEF